MLQISPMTCAFFDSIREIIEEEKENGCPDQLIKDFPHMAESIKFSVSLANAIDDMGASELPTDREIAKAIRVALKENPSYRNPAMVSCLREMEAFLDID